MSDDFTEREREALDAYDVEGAPSGFAERVLARADRARRLRWGALTAGLALAAGLVLWALVPTHEAGHAAVTERTSVPLGARGIAVAEAGSELDWQIDGGAAAVRQPRGAVFYRVERDGPFVVATPLGEVRVTGTCFEVEVVMNKLGSSALGVAVGAAATAAVLVTVYEGKVEVARGAQLEVVMPGERARLEPSGPIVVGAARTTAADGAEPAVAADVGAAHAPRPAMAGRAAGPSASSDAPFCAPCDARVEAAEAKARELDAKVAALTSQLGDATRRSPKTFDIPQEQLLAMAGRCELAWDTIPIRLDGPPHVPKEDVERGELSPEQVATIESLLGDEHALLVATIRQVYAAVMGEDPAASVAPTALVEEIEDKTPKPEMQRVFQLLSAERAGLAEPPPDDAPRPPVERLFRVLTSSGDRLQKKLAEHFGDDMAKAMREAHGGFGMASRSSAGCPSDGD
ncbi:MAG: hypothetical protein U1F43_09735 [Myxococcota bacterium]